MTRTILYMAHPLGDDVEGNIKRALRWLSWLRRSFPDVTFIAPWIAGVMSGDDDSDTGQREAGLVDDCATVARLDGIVLVGSRISSGMAREKSTAVEAGGEIVDLLHLGINAPTELYVWDFHGPVPPVLGRTHSDHPMAGAL